MMFSSVPPRVESTPSDGRLVVRKGTTITLECRGTGNPTPNITWTREVINFQTMCNHGYWNRVRQSYNSTILVILASVRCLRHNSRYSTQRIDHRSQSCLEGQIDSSDVRHVQIFPVPYRPFIRVQASLRYLIDYLGRETSR